MPFGRTLWLEAFTRRMSYRTIKPRETRPRDRSLPGKARTRARKAAQRAARVKP